MERELRDQLLRLLENNSKLSSQDLAVMLGATVEEVANEISVLEQEHVICGYHTLIDWNKINDDVTALVELRVTPQGGRWLSETGRKDKRISTGSDFIPDVGGL